MWRCWFVNIWQQRTSFPANKRNLKSKWSELFYFLIWLGPEIKIYRIQYINISKYATLIIAFNSISVSAHWLNLCKVTVVWRRITSWTTDTIGPWRWRRCSSCVPVWSWSLWRSHCSPVQDCFVSQMQTQISKSSLHACRLMMWILILTVRGIIWLLPIRKNSCFLRVCRLRTIKLLSGSYKSVSSVF